MNIQYQKKTAFRRSFSDTALRQLKNFRDEGFRRHVHMNERKNGAKAKI